MTTTHWVPSDSFLCMNTYLVSKFPLFLRTPVWLYWAQPKKEHHFNLITSFKTFSPNTVTFWGTEGYSINIRILGGHSAAHKQCANGCSPGTPWSTHFLDPCSHVFFVTDSRLGTWLALATGTLAKMVNLRLMHWICLILLLATLLLLRESPS